MVNVKLHTKIVDNCHQIIINNEPFFMIPKEDLAPAMIGIFSLANKNPITDYNAKITFEIIQYDVHVTATKILINDIALYEFQLGELSLRANEIMQDICDFNRQYQI